MPGKFGWLHSQFYLISGIFPKRGLDLGYLDTTISLELVLTNNHLAPPTFPSVF